MKTSIRYGAVLRCDIVTVSEDGTEHTHECQEKFVSYSMSGVVREQAATLKWTRAWVGRVRWPGQPPSASNKKVDVCPTHADLVITAEEAKELRAKKAAERKAARLVERAEAKAEKKRQKDAAREVAKDVKKQRARKKKGAEVAHV